MNITTSIMKQKRGFLALFLLASFLLVLSSCKKNDGFSGTPVITKVSLLDSSKVDSSFAKAYPGTLILITGENLGGVTSIRFNDFDVYFNPTYNTNTAIIVSIPANAPTEATNPNVPNTLKVSTTHGDVVYQFKLDIPPPVISSIVNENTLRGDSIVILGSNLWLIEKVVLPGNKEVAGTAVNSSKDGSRMAFILPDLGGANGRLTIQAKYGSTTSAAPINLHQGDSVLSNLTNAGEAGEQPVFNWAWWGAQRTDDASLFPGTRGRYLHNIFGGVGANDGAWWTSNRSGNFNEVTLFNDAIRSQQASNYALKFEMNTKEAWKTGIQVLRFGDDFAYRFMPYATSPDKSFHTNGKWQTVTVPLSDFKKKGKVGSADVEGMGANAITMADLVKAGGKVAFGYRFIAEGDPIDLFNAAYDNFRIVRIK